MRNVLKAALILTFSLMTALALDSREAAALNQLSFGPTNKTTLDEDAVVLEPGQCLFAPAGYLFVTAPGDDLTVEHLFDEDGNWIGSNGCNDTSGPFPVGRTNGGCPRGYTCR